MVFDDIISWNTMIFKNKFGNSTSKSEI